MIAKVKGKKEYLRGSYVVVGVSGVGYKVFITPYAAGKIAAQETVEFFTHTYVREDTLALYGFLTVEELEMFELLISVSGIGPKAGLGILSISDPKTVQAAILNDDPSILTRVSGVGKKTAERVILELQNKVADLSEMERGVATIDKDSIDALIAMGYSAQEARDALKSVPVEIKDVGERVRAALKSLGSKK